jgi:hypothetical protein
MTRLSSSVVSDLLCALRAGLSALSTSDDDGRPAKRQRTLTTYARRKPVVTQLKRRGPTTASDRATLCDLHAVLAACGEDRSEDLVSIAGRAYGAELALEDVRGDEATEFRYRRLPPYARG